MSSSDSSKLDIGHFYAVEYVNQNRIKIGVTRQHNPDNRIVKYPANYSKFITVESSNLSFIEKKVKDELKKQLNQFKKHRQETFETNDINKMKKVIWDTLNKYNKFVPSVYIPNGSDDELCKDEDIELLEKRLKKLKKLKKTKKKNQTDNTEDLSIGIEKLSIESDKTIKKKKQQQRHRNYKKKSSDKSLKIKKEKNTSVSSFSSSFSSPFKMDTRLNNRLYINKQQLLEPFYSPSHSFMEKSIKKINDNNNKNI